MVGWIKLHRKITECSIWDSDEPFDRRSAWMDLVMMVNHEDRKVLFNGKTIVVKAGQKITSVRKLSERWNWSKNKTLRFLMLLEGENMITKESDHNRTLLTIVNYDKYQGQWDSDGDSHGDTNGDSHGDADVPQTRNKRNKEIKKKNIYGTNHNVLLTDEEFEKLKSQFPDYQTRIDDLSFYLSSKGAKYASHYMTILSWARKDAKKTRAKETGFNQISKRDIDFEDLEKKLVKN